jgi:predicted DNA binding CopG/RHH family protein
MTELDSEEKNFLETFEAGEWQSVKEPARLQELQSCARAAIDKDKRTALRLSSIDLESI